MRRAILAAVMLLAAAIPLEANAASANEACTKREYEGSVFTVCVFDSRYEDLRLVWNGSDGKALRSFERLAHNLGPLAGNVRFSMNAGMFGTDGAPVGLFVEDGAVRHGLNTRNANGNFYMKPNGVFSLDAKGTVRVETTEQFASEQPRVLWATQSGPMLLVNGETNPQISSDGPSKNIRNGVGAIDAYRAAFVISEGPVSFGRLARFFGVELGCRNALYFDGSVSSIWIPAQARRDDAVPLGPMVVVMAKD